MGSSAVADEKKVAKKSSTIVDLMSGDRKTKRSPSNAAPIEGTQVQDPTYGMPAVWIARNRRDEALAKGYTVVEPAVVIATHLDHLTRLHAHELLGRQETQDLLDHIFSMLLPARRDALKKAVGEMPWKVVYSILVLAGLPMARLPAFYDSFLYLVFFWVSLSTSWALLSGFAGYFSLGHAAFYGAGMYTTAVMSAKFGVPFLLTLPGRVDRQHRRLVERGYRDRCRHRHVGLIRLAGGYGEHQPEPHHRRAHPHPMHGPLPDRCAATMAEIGRPQKRLRQMSIRSPPHSNGEVSRSQRDGGVMTPSPRMTGHFPM